MLHACCANTLISSTHPNARPRRLPPAGCHQGPHFLCAHATGWLLAEAFLGWACAPGSATCCPATADQLGPGQTRGLLCRPVGCNHPFFKECGPPPWGGGAPPVRPPSAPGTMEFSTVALYQSLTTFYNKLSLFTSHMLSTSQLVPDSYRWKEGFNRLSRRRNMHKSLCKTSPSIH